MSLTVDLPLLMPFSSCSDRRLPQNRVRSEDDRANDADLLLVEKHDREERVLCFFSHRPQPELGQAACL